MIGLSPADSCARGDLPPRNLYDISYCKLMYGPYTTISYRERQAYGSCGVKGCPQWIKSKGIDMAKKTIKACADCGRVMPMVARGLCGGCYHRHRHAGTLDLAYPAKATPVHKKPVAAGPVFKEVDFEVVKAETVGPAFSEVDFEVVKAAPACPVADEVEVVPGADVSDPDMTALILEFLPRDKDLLSYLEGWATEQRRTIEGQILFIIENMVFERNQEFAHLVEVTD